jgi:hypothetical protein
MKERWLWLYLLTKEWEELPSFELTLAVSLTNVFLVQTDVRIEGRNYTFLDLREELRPSSRIIRGGALRDLYTPVSGSTRKSGKKKKGSSMARKRTGPSCRH